MNYTEHNPSVTIYVKDSEWLKVANWVYDNWKIVGGLSFLPASDHIYQLAPYEEISELEYLRRTKEMKRFDLGRLREYESDDHTEPKRELACAGGACEL